MWERRIVDAILGHRVLVLGVIALLSAGAAVMAPQVGFDSDIEIWFLEDDPNLVTYHEFLERFGADEIAVIGLFGGDVFTPERLAALDRLTEAVVEVPHAWRVRSLTNARVVRSRGPGHIAVERLVEELPTDAEGAAALRTEALSHDTIRGLLVSEDGRAAAVVTELDPEGNKDFVDKVAFVRALREAAAEHAPPGLTVRVTGSPILDEAFYTYTERDFRLLGPLAALVVVLAALLLFRRGAAVVVPLAVVALANLWLFGLMGLFGLKINIVSTSLMALVLAVGVADSVHVVSDYYQQLVEGKPRGQAIAHATASLLVPCLFTSATTCAGFLSLLTSTLQPVRGFGWLAAIGVSFAFLLSMTVIPCVLSFLPAPDPRYLARQRDGRISRLLGWLGRPGPRRARWTLAISAGLVLLGVGSLGRLDTDANPMNYFLPGDPVRADMMAVDAELGGSSSFEFYVETQDGGLKDQVVLQRLADFRTRIESLPAITRVLSVLDSLSETRRVLTEGESDAVPGPDDHPNLAAQLYLFLESDSDFRDLIKGDYAATRMTARVQMSEANLLTARQPDIARWVEEDFQDDQLHIEGTGFIKLMSDMETYLFRSQVRSLAVAFSVIAVMMFLLLGSLRLGLFAMIPNFVPILLGLAFMAWVGVALDPATIMIGSMALGLVVDDTVHYLVRLRRNLELHDLPEAVARSMHQTGRPIIMTSLILAGGFGTMVFGSFTPNVAFGAVSAVVILLAVVADLLMLPAALLVLRPGVRSRTRG